MRVQGLTPSIKIALALAMAFWLLSGTVAHAQVSPPAIANVGVSEVEPGSATVFGTVTSGGLATRYEIDLGTDTTYGTSSAGEVLGESQAVSMTLLYLKPTVTYHYRIVASNEDETVSSGDRTFTTPAYPILLPPVLPQIASPAIAFPAEETTSKRSSKRKPAKRKAKKHKKRKHRKK
jgi:hypothetical protein